MVAEYLNHKMLSKLGIVSSVDLLPAYKVEIFGIISNEISRLEAIDLKRRQKKR